MTSDPVCFTVSAIVRVARLIVLLLVIVPAAPTVAGASVSSWQTCPIGPAGDTALCSSGRSPQDLESAGGSIWVTTAASEIIKVSTVPLTRGAMTFFAIPHPPGWVDGKVHGSDGIARGPDGNLWFAENYIARAGRMTTAGAFSFTGLTPYPDIKVRGARGIVRGPDGALWMTRFSGPMITRVTTGGTVTDFKLPGSDPFVALQEIISGPGSKLWFIRSGHRAIGSITTSGTPSEFTLPPGVANAAALTNGPDGAVWFTAVTTAAPRRGLVGRLAPGGSFRLFDLGTYIPRAIHSDGSQLWIGSQIIGPSGHAMLRMTTSGVITRVEPLLFRPNVSAITDGPDGAIWFTDLSGAQVGRIDGKTTPVAGAPTPVEIDPSSLAVTGSGVTLDLESSADADLDVRVALDSGSAGAGAIRVRGAKRVHVPAIRTVGSRSLRLKTGKRRISVPLPASVRRSLRRGRKLEIGVRATETTKRKTVVQATLRAR